MSAGQVFELGLFNTTSEDGEFRNYVGIWYRESPTTIVWVANRDKPIPRSNEFLVIVIDIDGNLKAMDSRRNSYFSTPSLVHLLRSVEQSFMTQGTWF